MKELHINHPSQLNSLSTLPWTGIKNIGKIYLEGEMQEHPRKKEFEDLLNRQYHACGCDTGAKGLLMGLIAGALYISYQALNNEVSTSRLLLTILATSIAGAVGGKFIGLYKANNHLRGTIEEIKKNWKTTEGQDEQIVCG